MDIIETKQKDSFTVCGSGFRYEYASRNSTLTVKDNSANLEFLRLVFDQSISADPLGYIHRLDKANKIKALALSNNTTTNLTQTISASRINGILNSTVRASTYAYMLEMQDHSLFTNKFVQNTAFKNMSIKHFQSRSREDVFFVGRIQTHNNMSINARGCTISTLLSSLSEKTARDLMTIELAEESRKTAQDLLNLSMRLRTISAIVDDNFIPENRIKKSVDSNGENTFRRINR